jgi:hypothetical protein
VRDDMDTPQKVTRFYGNVEFAMDVLQNRRIASIFRSAKQHGDFALELHPT